MDVTPSKFQDNFAKFLFGSDLMNLILAVYLGAVLQDFFNSLVEGGILPIIMKAIPGSKYTNFEDIDITIGGVTIKFGEIIMSTIKLFIGFLLTYLVIKYVAKRYI